MSNQKQRARVPQGARDGARSHKLGLRRRRTPASEAGERGSNPRPGASPREVIPLGSLTTRLEKERPRTPLVTRPVCLTGEEGSIPFAGAEDAQHAALTRIAHLGRATES